MVEKALASKKKQPRSIIITLFVLDLPKTIGDQQAVCN